MQSGILWRDFSKNGKYFSDNFMVSDMRIRKDMSAVDIGQNLKFDEFPMKYHYGKDLSHNGNQKLNFYNGYRMDSDEGRERLTRERSDHPDNGFKSPFVVNNRELTSRRNSYEGGHNDFGLMNGQDTLLQPPRPDMTRSLSCSADRQETGSARITNKPALLFTPGQGDGMMAAETEEGVINLSREVAPPQGDMPSAPLESPPHVSANGDSDHTSQGIPSPQINSGKSITAQSPVGASKRKPRGSSETSGRMSPLTNGMNQSVLMLAAQHGLTPVQVQQMLAAQQGAMAAPHLQQMMQAQQSVVMQQHQKAQEQALVQLNEQLQLNMLQQTQLLQDKKMNGKQTQQQLQTLAIQQQQLMQQIQQVQLQQRQFLVACLMTQPFPAQQAGMMSPGDVHQMWKDLAGSQGNQEESLKPSQNGINLAAVNGTSLGGSNSLMQGTMLGVNGLAHEAFPFGGPLIGQPQVPVKQEEGLSPLFRHGMCKWPGCDTECCDLGTFTKHLNTEHTLDDKNTAQARVQMQIVSQLEIQLTREKELLHAMMQHLHLRPQMDGQNDRSSDRKMVDKLLTSPKLPSSCSPVKPISNCLAINSSQKNTSKSSLPLHRLNPVAAGLPPLIIPPQTSLNSSGTPVTSAGLQVSSQPATPTGLGPMRRRVSDKCNLPISAEIQRNREFYKNTDVRPPFTYASLIRQAIIESENKQLTLNEVYQWFQNTFAYFRRNEATWKNAVRHNLSLHKCFMRVENVKGAVWTVDEVEFYKRRPQKLTGAIPGSPSLPPDSSIYGESINASLRAALEQNSLLGNYQINGSLSDGGAEDLSMKSLGNSNDSFSKSDSPHRGDSMYLRHSEIVFPMDEMNGASPHDYATQGLDLSPSRSSQQSPQVSQHSPKPQGPSPSISSVQSKQFMMDSPGNDAMDVQYETSTDGRILNQGPFIKSEAESFHQERVNMQVSENMDQLEQPVALNMKREVKDSEDLDRNGTLDLSTNSSEQSKSEEVDESLKDTEKLVENNEGENNRNASNRGSPNSLRASPVEQESTNQEMFSPLLQSSNMAAVVSHSMS